MNTKNCLLAFLVSCAFALVAAEPWEDPAVNAINRLPARGISVPCETEDLALDIAQGLRAKGDSRWIMPLNGEWDFKWKSATSVPDWEKSGKIAVPGCWQLQGDYDPALYSNVTYPIERDAPRVTKEPANKAWTAFKFRNPVGLYTTTFKRPWRWWFRRTVLHFNGVSSAFRVRVNGKDVGYAEDSRLPSEFDLTPYLNVFFANTLEVEVYKHCDGTYLEAPSWQSGYTGCSQPRRPQRLQTVPESRRRPDPAWQFCRRLRPSRCNTSCPDLRCRTSEMLQNPVPLQRCDGNPFP
ncbi:MAG: hypothetical protein IKC53_10720 [Lentisphaeria bacterium]|nr:hypothetical protein [Lentisphaeria bacterium]